MTKTLLRILEIVNLDRSFRSGLPTGLEYPYSMDLMAQESFCTLAEQLKWESQLSKPLSYAGSTKSVKLSSFEQPHLNLEVEVEALLVQTVPTRLVCQSVLISVLHSPFYT